MTQTLIEVIEELIDKYEDFSLAGETGEEDKLDTLDDIKNFLLVDKNGFDDIATKLNRLAALSDSGIDTGAIQDAFTLMVSNIVLAIESLRADISLKIVDLKT